MPNFMAVSVAKEQDNMLGLRAVASEELNWTDGRFPQLSWHRFQLEEQEWTKETINSPSFKLK